MKSPQLYTSRAEWDLKTPKSDSEDERNTFLEDCRKDVPPRESFVLWGHMRSPIPKSYLCCFNRNGTVAKKAGDEVRKMETNDGNEKRNPKQQSKVIHFFNREKWWNLSYRKEKIVGSQ